MKYHTKDELEHFGFSEAVVVSVRLQLGSFYMELDNVTIHPENSCNRDIRAMRANGLRLKLPECEMVSFAREAYKVYDADGNLTQTEEDQEVDREEYADTFQKLEGMTVYDITKQDQRYHIELDVEEFTYHIDVKASQDEEEWDRFLSKEVAI
ncbi:MAG: subtilin biosynthesis sensor protein SpaK [Eubacteriales bacterium]|nr:subtilin biosynthesis sensor protein SpaK [Eubacteriales bacterium]